MSHSLKRVGAILMKELQDIRTNANVLVMFLLPIFIFLIYKQFMPDYPKSWVLAFSLTMLIGEVAIFVLAMLIAEEKEKRTLEVLMLSPARPLEVFAGKGLLTLLLVVLFTLILVFLSGTGMAGIGPILVGTLLSTVVCIFLGMLVGLLAANQMATGIIALPIILPFILIPFLSTLGDEIVQKISLFIPTYHYYMMITLSISRNLGLTALLPYIGALAGSGLIFLGILQLVYRKKGLE